MIDLDHCLGLVRLVMPTIASRNSPLNISEVRNR